MMLLFLRAYRKVAVNLCMVIVVFHFQSKFQISNFIQCEILGNFILA